LFAVGLIATFVVTYVITGIAKKALNEKLVNEEPSTPDAPAEL
jgi:hypothetical protein